MAKISPKDLTAHNRTAGVPTSSCRHFHCVQADPYNGATYWMSSGDMDANCKIWKSTDYGYTWTLMGNGSQEFRTLGFVFTEDYMYWVMDNEDAAVECKIFRSSRTDLSARVAVATVADNMPTYGVTRIFWPPGILVFPNHEPTSIYANELKIQFYDIGSNTLKTIAKLPKFDKLASDYYGFNASSRYACRLRGVFTVEYNMTIDEYTGGASVTGYLVGKLAM